MRFAELTAPEIGQIEAKHTLVLAPIAACEQHSRHLPVFTDSILCGAVAEALELALPDQVLMLPLLWLGASEHHLPFGGTLTATLPTFETLLTELLAPLLESGLKRVMILNGHGGNIEPLRVALRRLDNQYPDAILTGAAYWELAEVELAALCDGPRKHVGHACEIETSMMLHLRPELVKNGVAVDDPAGPPTGLERLFWARNFQRRTRHGAVGYPKSASAEKGARMFEAVVERLVETARQLLAVPLPE